jgi:hypothetical protein
MVSLHRRAPPASSVSSSREPPRSTSSVRHAADADSCLVVVEDGCSDRDPEVHRVLVEKVSRGRPAW